MSKTRFMSINVTIVVAVTAMFGGAATVSASASEKAAREKVDIATSPKTELKIGSSYNLTLQARTPYDYTIVVPVSGNFTFTYETHFAVGGFWLVNAANVEGNIKPTGSVADVGKGSVGGFVSNKEGQLWSSDFAMGGHSGYFSTQDPATEKSTGSVTYRIDKGTYYLRVVRGPVGLSDLKLGLSLKNPDSNSVDANGTDVGGNTAGGNTAGGASGVPQPPFIAGSVVSNVTSARNGNAISVNWGAVSSARYIVYYTYQNANGTFAAWSVNVVDTPAYTIPTPAAGVTYYITILPYGDNPRTYGGFSAYSLVRT